MIGAEALTKAPLFPGSGIKAPLIAEEGLTRLLPPPKPLLDFGV